MPPGCFLPCLWSGSTCERGHAHSHRVHSQSPSLPLGQAFPAAKKTLPEAGGPSPGCRLIACVAPAGLPAQWDGRPSRAGAGAHFPQSRGAGKRFPGNTRDAHSRAFSPVIHLSPSLLSFVSFYSGREGGAEGGGKRERLGAAGTWGQAPGTPPPGLAAAEGISQLRPWHRGAVERAF